MSYMQLRTEVKSDKGVISLWFRVPQESIDACIAAAADNHEQLNSIIPFVTFGGPMTQKIYNTPFVQMATGTVYTGTHDPNVSIPVACPIGAFLPEGDGGTIYLDPSYIGLECGVDGFGVLRLYVVVHLQTDAHASVEGLSYTVGAVAEFETGASDPSYEPSEKFDMSSTFTGKPESYDISITVDDPESFADTWHHLLVSFDLSNEVLTTGTDEGSSVADGVESSNKMWGALDDVNKTGYDLLPNWPGPGAEVNDTITNLTYAVAAQNYITPIRLVPATPPVPNPTYEEGFNSPTLNASSRVRDKEFEVDPAFAILEVANIDFSNPAFPAATDFVDSILTVELAEFLMFTDITLDTSVEENRRLFITGKDHKGRQFPVNGSPIAIPINKLAIGDPATWEPGADIAAFVPGLINPAFMPTGVKLPGGDKTITADIDFTKCSLNWIMGNNMGAAKSKSEHTGKIRAYFPDPVLEEDPGG